jgi:predicted ArsR family transcriptional regulator
MERLEEIAAFFGMDRVEIISPPQERQEIKSYRRDLENAILETISRRPCTLSDLEKILGLHVNEINKYLGVLEESGKIESSSQERGTFYHLKVPD